MAEEARREDIQRYADSQAIDMSRVGTTGKGRAMTAAIYARKSTDQHGVSEAERSVARQMAHARAYATEKGWRVSDAHVYVDDGISGRSLRSALASSDS